MPTLTIRPARPEDRDTILALVRAVFTRRGGTGEDEVKVVRRTWELAAAPPGFDLVAIEDGEVVGHVLAAPGDLDGARLPGIAPLGVRRDRQRQGIGTALVTELLRRIRDDGWPAVLLLGDPGYYGRFGFEPAEALGIFYPPVRSRDFQINRFEAGRPLPKGAFRYCWEDPAPVG